MKTAVRLVRLGDIALQVIEELERRERKNERLRAGRDIHMNEIGRDSQ